MVRQRRVVHGLLAMWMAAVSAAALAGCWPFDPTADLVGVGYVCEDGTPDCFKGTGGGGTGGTGGTTTVNPGCVPNQTGDAIDDGCGFFVSTVNGNDGNSGASKDEAVATLGKAISLAKGKPIYACANATKAFEEAIEIDSDVTIYGGLDCATWKYVAGSTTKWTASGDALPLRVLDGAKVMLADVAIEAADAVTEGGSSIAVVAQANATVEFFRCAVSAGNGKDGRTPEAPMGSGMGGVDGDPGATGCDNDQGEFGGKGGQLMCDAMSVSGGLGGQGTTADAGGPGGNGFPADTFGKGGVPQSFNGMSTTECTAGGDGAEGVAGEPGTSASGKPAISATGYQGKDGADGTSIGKPGQGGGGGGGAKKCGINAGPSAGGGGSGGCGGAVGKGGHAGGASIGILSLGATLLLSDVTVVGKNGGNGGDGGQGQPGGDGGAGGPAGMGQMGAIACAGGKGGKGGSGGRGGGGLGGASMGIAHTGEAPDVTAATIVIASGGKGGAGEVGNAESGIASEVEGF